MCVGRHTHNFGTKRCIYCKTGLAYNSVIYHSIVHFYSIVTLCVVHTVGTYMYHVVSIQCFHALYVPFYSHYHVCVVGLYWEAPEGEQGP